MEPPEVKNFSKAEGYGRYNTVWHEWEIPGQQIESKINHRDIAVMRNFKPDTIFYTQRIEGNTYTGKVNPNI